MILGTILVLENDHESRVTLRQVLEAAGYHVSSFANAYDNLASIKDIAQPIVIFASAELPGVVKGQYSELSANLKDVPFVQIKRPYEMDLAGAACAIHRPIRTDEVLGCVQVALSRRDGGSATDHSP